MPLMKKNNGYHKGRKVGENNRRYNDRLLKDRF